MSIQHRGSGLLATTLVLGCAATISTSTTVTYVAPRPLTVDTVAILPVSSGEGLEGFRRMISDSLLTSLTRSRRVAVIIPAESTLARLNSAGITDRYAQAIRDYQQTSVLNRTVVDTMSRVVRSRYLLYTRAAYEAGRSVAGNFLTGYSSRRDQNLQLFVHVWDGHAGDVVWEAVSNSAVSATEMQISRGLDEILAASVTDLVAKFLAPPTGRRARGT
jgi:hypothetical protein